SHVVAYVAQASGLAVGRHGDHPTPEVEHPEGPFRAISRDHFPAAWTTHGPWPVPLVPDHWWWATCRGLRNWRTRSSTWSPTGPWPTATGCPPRARSPSRPDSPAGPWFVPSTNCPRPASSTPPSDRAPGSLSLP